MLPSPCRHSCRSRPVTVAPGTSGRPDSVIHRYGINSSSSRGALMVKVRRPVYASTPADAADSARRDGSPRRSATTTQAAAGSGDRLAAFVALLAGLAARGPQVGAGAETTGRGVEACLAQVSLAAAIVRLSLALRPPQVHRVESGIAQVQQRSGGVRQIEEIVRRWPPVGGARGPRSRRSSARALVPLHHVMVGAVEAVEARCVRQGRDGRHVGLRRAALRDQRRSGQVAGESTTPRSRSMT